MAVLDAAELDHLRTVYRSQADQHLPFLSDASRRAFDAIIEHPRFAGSTDPPALALVASIVACIQPASALELGTHIGLSALCIADQLARNERPGRLVTVEPGETIELAREFVDRAGLAEIVTFVRGYSTAPEVVAQIRSNEPFDLVYIDSSHSYSGTVAELDLIFGPDGIASESAFVLLHDATPLAASFDPTGEGGVPRALEEWVGARSDAFQLFVFAPPLWPCGCGLGLVSRRPSRES